MLRCESKISLYLLELISANVAYRTLCRCCFSFINVTTYCTKTYTIGNDVDKLTGVYNINKGYAVFKQINILTKNEDYAIIETKTTYGISLYDHIALDGSKVKENQLVIK